ncbi:MAG: GNAT family N-acetyltransferase, partial [Candidatus Hermodarchaeota archaeon]|nr:GNAT family N-acetyltransferase [Candidatus Hermodarchaeota archaeon]
MAPPRIRPMRQDDWSSFDILDQETFPGDRVTRNYFDLYLASNGFYALESDTGDLLGYVKITDLKDGTGFLSRIAVTQALQQQGLGSNLVEFCLRWFRERNVRQIDLNTQDFNVSAQRLYQKFGFIRVGTMWHYIVSFKVLQPESPRYKIQILKPEEIGLISQLFPKTMGISR